MFTFLKRLLSKFSPEKEKPKSNEIWCVVANVVDEHTVGQEKVVQRGTRHFRPGAKVYCFPPMWGDGYENIKVVGHHKGSHRLVTLVMPSRRLENWRAKVVYSPAIIKRMNRQWDGTQKSKELAVKIVEAMIGRRAAEESQE